MQVVAIKRGNVLELSEALDIPDGQAVTVEITEIQERSGFSSLIGLDLSPEEREELLNRVIGAWKDDEELDEIFAEIDRERHLQFGRDINSLDD